MLWIIAIIAKMVELFEDGSILFTFAEHDFSACIIRAWGC